MHNLRAVILAGGKGNRLDKYGTPKPLVRVGGRTLLSRTIGMLQTAGIKDISVLVSKDDQTVSAFIIKKFGSHGSVGIIRPKEEPSSEFEAMLSVENDDAADIIITATDLVFASNPYQDLVRTRKSDITALVCTDAKRNSASGAKVKSLCANDKIIAVGAKLEHFDSMLVGTYRFSPKGFAEFKKRGIAFHKESYPDKLFEDFAKEEKLGACSIGSIEWYDVNTPETLIRAELLSEKLSEQRISFSLLKKFESQSTFKPTTHFNNNKKQRTDILIERGILHRLDEQDIIPEEYSKSPHFIITDKRVYELYGKKIENSLLGRGFKIQTLIVEEGEGSKAIETYTMLAQDLLERGIDKRSIIISLGGGVINNIAGFLAATIYRGIGLIHIPTTLLAQNDAAIGIKQGINGPMGKNLIGSKYSPMRIIVDADVLQTLSERQIRDGLNECIKHALAQDRKFYDYLMKYEGNIADLSFLEHIVKKNIELKVKLMQHDFDEEREALVLLYGHEVGHAIEYLSGFSYGHGEAIAVGMRVSIEIASLLEKVSPEVIEQHKALFKKYGIKTTIPASITVESIMNMLRFDKKFHGGDVYFALISKIGTLYSRKGEYLIPVSESIIVKALENSYVQ